MPQGRFVSRSISENLELSKVSLEADYLFGRCIPHLDRDGRMVGHPVLVKSVVCPLRQDIDSGSIPDLLHQLGGQGLLHWYEAEGKQVLEFPGFANHQRGIKYEREAPSRFPSSTCETARDLLRIKSGLNPDLIPLKLSEVEVEVKSKLSEVKALVEFDNSTSNPMDVIVQRFEDVEARSNGTKRKEEALDLATAIVFRYWMAKLDHPRAKLDKKRRTRIASRLRENNCDVDELLYVIDGAKRDDWTMGRDPRSTKAFDGIETIFRDRGQVEKFTDMVPNSDQRPHPLLKGNDNGGPAPTMPNV